MVAGLVPVVDGSVIVLCEEVNSRSPHETRDGARPCARGSVALFHLSVRENLRLGEGISAVLTDAEHRAQIGDFTHDVGRRHFSYEVLGEPRDLMRSFSPSRGT